VGETGPQAWGGLQSCTEDGVRWVVMKSPVEVSQEQIDYHHALFGDTARPVQPLHGRLVTEF
jgi:carbonic anhydrase